MNKVATFAVLGDSAAFGVGDVDANGVTKGWGYYLTKSFIDPVVYINLSRPGAQSAEVLEHQLPIIKAMKPDITAVIVGGNDALRNGFNPDRLRQNLRQTILQLNEIGSEVLLLELHDPTRIVPLPSLLAKILSRRIDAVNIVMHSLSQEFDAQILKSRSIKDIYDRKVWHIDRMHPSKFGHQLIAEHFRALLLDKHWNIAPIVFELVPQKRKRESMVWMLRNGTPWFFKRSFDLFPVAIILMTIELFKIVFHIQGVAIATVYYPEFVLQSQRNLLEVYEERVP